MPIETIVSVTQERRSRPAPDLTAKLCSFIELVQDYADVNRFPEIAELNPRMFAHLALRRWLRLGIMAEERTKDATSRYDLSEKLKLAGPKTVDVTACMLVMPQLRCDPSTEKWSIRPEYADHH